MEEIKIVEMLEEVKPIKRDVYEVRGKTFDTLKKAQYYLREVLYKELFNDIPKVEDEKKQTWYYCKSFNHLLAVFGYNRVYDYYKNGIDIIKFPQWICVYASDHGDYGDWGCWETLDELINETNNKLAFINKINNIK